MCTYAWLQTEAKALLRKPEWFAMDCHLKLFAVGPWRSDYLWHVCVTRRLLEASSGELWCVPIDGAGLSPWQMTVLLAYGLLDRQVTSFMGMWPLSEHEGLFIYWLSSGPPNDRLAHEYKLVMFQVPGEVSLLLLLLSCILSVTHTHCVYVLLRRLYS